jgi:hypothetical protein
MSNNNQSEWSTEYSGVPLMEVGDKCLSHDGDTMRNATVINVNRSAKTYDVEIDGLGTKMSNIPMHIWRPVPIKQHQERAEKHARPSLSAEINSMLDEAFNEGVDQAIGRISHRKEVYLREPELTSREKLFFGFVFDHIIRDLQQLKKQQ